MATNQGPIENLPVAKDSISEHKHYKKYKEEIDPLTKIVNPEIGPLDIMMSKYILLTETVAALGVYFGEGGRSG